MLGLVEFGDFGCPQMFWSSWLWTHLACLLMVSLSLKQPSNDKGGRMHFQVGCSTGQCLGHRGEWGVTGFACLFLL